LSFLKQKLLFRRWLQLSLMQLRLIWQGQQLFLAAATAFALAVFKDEVEVD